MSSQKNRFGFISAGAVGASLLAANLLPRQASASTILTESGSANVQSTSTPAENLTTDGTVDWASWNGSTTGTATNIASGLTDIFSNMTAKSGGTPRSSTQQSVQYFTYTNGTSPISATNARMNPVLDPTLNTVGSGLTFTITGNPNSPETADIFIDGANTGASFSASLEGQTVTDNSVTFTSANPNLTAEYTITFEPNSASDPLVITCTNSGTQGGFGYVGLLAVAVGTATPEPASLALFAGAGCLLLRRRRSNDGRPVQSHQAALPRVGRS